ncbi:hypothetical protein [Polaromonas sp. DSP2-3-2b2]|uniref:hypothetical protein n=1 Tax=Polaromonas sp. DSP2-3-2b2 TaxID=2804662 RepID=UPI003CF3F2CF
MRGILRAPGQAPTVCYGIDSCKALPNLRKAGFSYIFLTTNAFDLIAAFSVSVFVFGLGALGSFFCGLRGERLPGGGNFLFWQKRNSRKKVAWGSGAG